MTASVLSLQDVRQHFASRAANGRTSATVKAVDGVSLDVRAGEVLAIVGESGSGKSTLAKLLLNLSKPTSGSVLYEGKALESLDRSSRAAYRRNVQAVFQDPASSLNPRMTVARSLGFILRRHRVVGRGGEREFITRLLGSVEFEPPEDFVDRYPHQLSGGQQQRVAIARAIMLQPKVIVADEPLSSLDVSIQAQVLRLIHDLRARTAVGFVVISHDLGAMETIADRTAVMYRGCLMEVGRTIYARPAHPYSRLLLDARLLTDPARNFRVRSPQAQRPVSQTKPGQSNDACRFAHRCPHAIDICLKKEPPLRPVGQDGTLAACHRAEEMLSGQLGDG